MPIVSLRIPQMGEGLHEARIVALLKKEGDQVQRDEAIYQMETDKAVLDIESPQDGRLVEWLAQTDQIVEIGQEIAKIEVVEAVVPVSSSEVTSPGTSRAVIPPRTRAYAREKAISEAELQTLAAGSEKLLPADIDRYLATLNAAADYVDSAVSSSKRILNSRLMRASQLVVPGSLSVALDWEGIARERSRLKHSSEELKPTSFAMFSFCVAQAVKHHPKFRTTLVGEDTFRTFNKLSLGIAVALPEDELALAVIEDAENLTWREFVRAFRTQIDLARAGRDQAHESVTLSLTNMQGFGLRNAVPVVVPPAVATLFLGETYIAPREEDGVLRSRLMANVALTFDHRVMNGVGAAQFVASVKKKVEQIEGLLTM